jgi:hypothetical protein
VTSKQSRKKSALILASQFGALFNYGTLLLSFFYFKTGANEFVNLKWDEVTFAELSIHVIVRISIPNETYDLKENFTVVVPPAGNVDSRTRRLTSRRFNHNGILPAGIQRN